MQFTFNFDDRPEKLVEIHRRLRQHFGLPQQSSPTLDPVGQLVMGIISGRTQGEVYWSVFKELQRRFASWDDLRDAPIAEIENAISRVTYPEDKALRLKQALEQIAETCGELTLDWLDSLTVDEALAWLERLPGVGRKASAATLNFSTLNKPALVIDTHHLRVISCIGLVRKGSTYEQAYGGNNATSAARMVGFRYR